MTNPRYKDSNQLTHKDLGRFAHSDTQAAHTTPAVYIAHTAAGRRTHLPGTAAASAATRLRSLRPRHLLQITLVIAAALFLLLTDIWYLESGSMLPSYPVGSIIVTSRYIKPAIGSVCAYRHNSITIIHRIIAESDDGFILKGDANNVEDPSPVAAEDIEGVMLFGLRPIL